MLINFIVNNPLFCILGISIIVIPLLSIHRYNQKGRWKSEEWKKDKWGREHKSMLGLKNGESGYTVETSFDYKTGKLTNIEKGEVSKPSLKNPLKHGWIVEINRRGDNLEVDNRYEKRIIKRNRKFFKKNND